MSKYYAHINSKNVLTGIDMSKLVKDKFDSTEVQNIEVTEDIYLNREKYIYSNGEIVLDPNYKEKEVQKRQEQFETEFFNTSLGYVRRKVTMANGDTKDFLTDLLPSIAMGIQLNQPVSIITYKEPDFTEKVTDLVKYQEVKQATAEFVQECFMQLNNDFLPQKTNESIEEDTDSEPPVDEDTGVVTNEEEE